VKRFLIDTGPLAALLLGRSGATSIASPWVTQRQAATCVINYAEVQEYIKGFPDHATRHQDLQDLLTGVHMFVLTRPILERYAEIRRDLRPKGKLIGDMDILIAATALERQLTVVTTDSDFLNAPDLAVMVLTSKELA
jgi:predicted nucleic acid-binding protein